PSSPRPESRPHWRRRSASGRGPGPSLHRRRTPGRSRTGTDSPAAGTTGTSPGPGCRLQSPGQRDGHGTAPRWDGRPRTAAVSFSFVFLLSNGRSAPMQKGGVP
ncbi:hypothetical protein BFDFBN_BFDFBN_15480, partial [Dysosmobacter welbionis]